MIIAINFFKRISIARFEVYPPNGIKSFDFGLNDKFFRFFGFFLDDTYVCPIIY